MSNINQNAVIVEKDERITDLLMLIEMLWQRVQFLAIESGVCSFNSEEDRKIKEKIQEINSKYTRIITKEESYIKYHDLF